MAKISIAFGVTGDWIKYSLVTICSILSASDKNDVYKFYILSDISEESFEEIYNKFSEKLSKNYSYFLEYKKLNDLDFTDVVHDKRVGISAYFRLKLPSILNEDKIIYLDSDTVVLNDIKNLWNYDITDYYIAAAEDKYSNLMGCRANLPEGSIYYNSGVMLMNLKLFREADLEGAVFSKLREPGNDYSDQDVLNDLCRERILSLPLKYNLMLTGDDPNSFPARKEEYSDALKSPVILHYAVKPWVLPVGYSEYWCKYSDMIGLVPDWKKKCHS